ncbi:MAG TPA: rhomboid family intramembrane serine protease [Phycisphaerae bacterium]|nr:rhomboid family intramembrane serine protease [Phycisphaerae bacterium]HQE28085.1 rhomboid family intramembrane serine protease [Phycisphaerae bacterium]
MFLPIATDTSVRRTPWVNYGLIGLNVFVFMVQNVATNPRMGSAALAAMIGQGVFQGDEPRLFQFFTYQFLHADLFHLGGNMLFLWLFGNAVNAKMGHLSYLLFYLAGGEAAALGFMLNHNSPMVGASGAIAAVTTAYLAMFPRSRITVLYWWFFIGTFELPSMIMIVFKMIMWDNIIAPRLGAGMNVAFDAHLAGYAFGFLTITVLLALHVLPRDQFDIIALWKRWFQRQSLRSAMSTPQAQARAQFGRVARPVSFDDVRVRVTDPLDDNNPVTQLRQEIIRTIDEGNRSEAARLYEKLLDLDPRQVLGRNQQLDIANQLYSTERFPQAAAAYEKFLSTYPSAQEAPQIELLLGIIYARDLHQYEVAEEHLKRALERITDDRRREQARHWLEAASQALGRPAPQA